MGGWVNKLARSSGEMLLINKKNELLTHSTTWMKLIDIMLSVNSQSQKVTRVMIPFV